MRPGVILSALLLAACPSPAKEPVMQKPRELVSDLSQYAVPKGWTAEDGASQGDPQATLSKDLHVITVRLSGGKDSRYKTPGDFLVGFEARSNGGKPAEKLQNAAAGGSRVIIYRRKVPVRLPAPDASGPAGLTSEEFCVVPAGKRFFILKYSYGDTIPDPAYDGRETWRRFLKDFKLKRKTAGSY